MNLTPNIGKEGRIVRLIMGILCFIGAWAAQSSGLPAIVLGLAGLFCLFQAVKGWCLARACGIKTRI